MTEQEATTTYHQLRNTLLNQKFQPIGIREVHQGGATTHYALWSTGQRQVLVETQYSAGGVLAWCQPYRPIEIEELAEGPLVISKR